MCQYCDDRERCLAQADDYLAGGLSEDHPLVKRYRMRATWYDKLANTANKGCRSSTDKEMSDE